MAVSPIISAYVLDQFAPFAKLTSRRMFGAIGLYWNSHFIAVIDDDTLYLKADDSNRNEFLSRGCRPFQPTPDMTSMNYYEAPQEVLEDSETLESWARKSYAIAARQALAKAAKKSKKTSGTKRSAKRKTTSR